MPKLLELAARGEREAVSAALRGAGFKTGARMKFENALFASSAPVDISDDAPAGRPAAGPPYQVNE